MATSINDSELFARIRPLIVDSELLAQLDARIAKATRPRARKSALGFEPLTDEQRAQMTDAEIHAYYKRTGHIESVRFAIRFGIVDDMPADLARDWRELLTAAEAGLTRTDTLRRLWSLVGRWNTVKIESERDAYRKGPNFSQAMIGAMTITVDLDRLHACRWKGRTS